MAVVNLDLTAPFKISLPSLHLTQLKNANHQMPLQRQENKEKNRGMQKSIVFKLMVKKHKKTIEKSYWLLNFTN